MRVLSSRLWRLDDVRLVFLPGPEVTLPVWKEEAQAKPGFSGLLETAIQEATRADVSRCLIG
jgi:hypothetical protein